MVHTPEQALNLTHKIEQFTIIQECIQFLKPAPNGFDSRRAVAGIPFLAAQPTGILHSLFYRVVFRRFEKARFPQENEKNNRVPLIGHKLISGSPGKP
jgi:hypothetical protein